MLASIQDKAILSPPTALNGLKVGEKLTLPASDPICARLADWYGQTATDLSAWTVARLSPAVYVYREDPTGLAMAAKFYSVKTGASAREFAEQEFAHIKQAQSLLPTTPASGVITPLFVWRGVLFLEYVPGLTLHDVIGSPGDFTPCLEQSSRFLAGLHRAGQRSSAGIDVQPVAAYAAKLLEQLSHQGVFDQEELFRNDFAWLLRGWLGKPALTYATPCICHGDPTSTNFLVLDTGQIVALDWEYLTITDPAADLGRFVAEISHSLHHHGKNGDEITRTLAAVMRAYHAANPTANNLAELAERARFYQAITQLRMARNNWLTDAERGYLLNTALTLLSS